MNVKLQEEDRLLFRFIVLWLVFAALAWLLPGQAHADTDGKVTGMWCLDGTPLDLVLRAEEAPGHRMVLRSGDTEKQVVVLWQDMLDEIMGVHPSYLDFYVVEPVGGMVTGFRHRWYTTDGRLVITGQKRTAVAKPGACPPKKGK